MLGSRIMMRGSQVPEPNPMPAAPPNAVKRFRRPLKFLGAYAVGVVNVVAVLYIVIKVVVAGIRRLTE